MDDSEIINLYFRRSERAVAETHSKYGHYCLTIANRILACLEDAEETVNDTYLAAWKTIPPQRPPVFSLFLGKITRNLSIDRWRAQMSEKRGGREFTCCLDELTACVSGETSLEQAEIQKETLAALNRFLRRMPSVERNVFLCRYWRMDSVAEIADLFGFSQTKVTTMLYRTRRKLRAQMEKEGLL